MYHQTVPLNESSDISKNLVSGEFERDYREAVMEMKPKKRQGKCLALMLAVVGVLTLGFIVLLVIREVQLRTLRDQVDYLSGEVTEMKLAIQSLNDNVIRELTATETFGDDYIEIPVDDDDKDTSRHDTVMGSIDGITVMESDDEYDDEDTGDDEESGDWHPDYRHQPFKIEDDGPSTGSVVSMNVDVKLNSKIRELKKLLNDDSPNLEASKPDSAKLSPRVRRSAPVEPPADVDYFAAPRLLANTNDRRKSKKYQPAVSSESQMIETKSTKHSPTRITRNSEDEENIPKRPFIAAHFHGNTSHLNTEVHSQYKGNGLVRLPHGSHHDVWYPSSWTASAAPASRPSLSRSGHIRVHHTGVYLVYVQIYFLDTHDIVSWVLHRTHPQIEGRETLLQCTLFTPSSEHMEKPNSCFSSAALLLRAGDKLAVRNTGGDRHSLMQPEKSFIGLVKLADAEYPNDDL